MPRKTKVVMASDLRGWDRVLLDGEEWEVESSWTGKSPVITLRHPLNQDRRINLDYDDAVTIILKEEAQVETPQKPWWQFWKM